MAEYTYDPTQGKIVPVSQARVVTYITNDPGGMPASNEAAREATGSSSGAQPQTGSAASYGLADSQNAARLEAERIAAEKSPYNVRSATGDELLKKQAAINAANAPARYVRPTPTSIPTPTPKPTPVAVASIPTPTPTPTAKTTVTSTKPQPKSPGKAWIWDGSKWVKPPLPTKNEIYTWNDETGYQLKNTNVDFASLPANEQTAINAIGEQGLGTTATTAAATVTRNTEIDKLEAELAAAIAAGKKAEADKIAAELKATQDAAAKQVEYEKFLADQVAASTKTLKEQMAASKLAYDTAAQDKTDAIKVGRVDAYETLKTEFAKYGLGSLAESVEALILNGTTKSQATLKLRATPQYKLRFAGNEIRLKEGKNLYDEGTYLALENDFAESFAAYGQNALLGPTRESAQAKFSEYIGMDKSPVEIKNRIKLAVEEVKGRPEILKTFKEYFPSLDENDLVSYFLAPEDTLTRLETKVQTARIGAAASRQGLTSSVENSLDLAQFNITEQQANIGYQKIASDLPTMEKLGSIDNININQTTAENAYLKGLASEQRKIDQAVAREKNRFDSSAGNAAGAYSTGYLKKSSAAGQI